MNVMNITDLLTTNGVLGAFITGLIGPLTVYLVRQYVTGAKRKHTERYKEFSFTIKNQNLVNTSLNSLQEHYSVDRVWICQFHNGGNFWPGNQSMKKISVMFESTAAGVSTDIMKMQNIPVSFFSSIIEQMIERNTYSHLIIKEVKDNALRCYWESRGVGLVYIFPIYNLKELLIGMMCVEQLDEDCVLDQEKCHGLSDSAKQLSGYIVNLSTRQEF
jgi:hypothetical protein